MPSNGIYTVFKVHPDQDLYHQLVGRIALNNNNIEHLEDYHGDIESLLPSGLTTPTIESRLESLLNGSNPYFVAVSHNDWLDNKHPYLPKPPNYPDDDLNLEEVPGSPEASEKPQVLSSFHYHLGNEDPLQLDCLSDGNLQLAGHVISGEAAQKILDSLDMGKAALRHPMEVAKSDDFIENNLFKIEPNLSQAIEHIREGVKAGHIHPQVLKTLTRHLFHDTMIPSLGNRKSFEDFSARPREGVHVAIDMDHLKRLNDTHGHKAGDDAIKALGNSIRESADVIGKRQGKNWHISGDEFISHFPTPEHAKKFVSLLKQKLAAHPLINGTHKLSASMGLGRDSASADRALYAAKEAKKMSGKPPGQTESHAHSLIGGHEGVI